MAMSVTGVREASKTDGPLSEGSTVRLAPGALVSCTDGTRGVCTKLVLDPTALRITHLVVGLRHLKMVDHLVPVGWIREADAELIALNRTRLDVTFEPSFTVISEEQTEHYLYESCVWELDLGYEWRWPYVRTDAEHVVVREESLPREEVAWGKKTRAYDASGAFAGRLAAVDLERGSGKVRQVLLRKGHLAKSNVAVTAPQILGAADDLITLESATA
jgi:hypothetical protein